MHSDEEGGSIWMVRGGEKCQTEIIHHHAI